MGGRDASAPRGPGRPRQAQGRARLTSGLAGPPGPRSGRGGRPSTGPASVWLELAVEADSEAVEAVSEILGRAASGGVAIEPAFETVDEGLSGRFDPTRPQVVRAYLPAGDGRAQAEAAAAIEAARSALGHLQAFGLRPIGELTTRELHAADWANAWKRHFPVLRVGR
ncbi:MAG: hypothetical protein EPN50_08025, partial [Chloroflexota bacterium]